MSKTASSGDSLTLDDIQRFIDSDFSGNNRTLIAPNKTVADLWAKQYPGWQILISSHNLPLAPKSNKSKEG